MKRGMPITEIERKIHACWMGKNIGGTFGGPHEGKPGPLDLHYYDPVPTISLPNDDLDLQLVWLHHLRSTGATTITAELLAQAWKKHVLFPMDEYGIVRRNEAYGLKGPVCGQFDNYFSESMGAAIRSELWACISAGEPERAASFAWADAAVDHCGDGVYAEMFHAAMQAEAFSESSLLRIIQTGLAFVPGDTRLGRALGDTMRWCAANSDWREVRSRIIERHFTGNFTDVVCNLCFEVLALIIGDGDFERTICIAVNCGADTDCTAATIGALLGIRDPREIPSRWSQPIGEAVVVSDFITGITPPANVTELTAWTMQLSRHWVPKKLASR